MKILVASQDLTSELNASISRGLIQQGLVEKEPSEFILLPFDGQQQNLISDLQQWNGGDLQDFVYYGPNWESTQITYLLTKFADQQTAVIDTSDFTDRQLTSQYDHHDLFHASSYGLGQLILDAVTNEAKEVVLLIDDTSMIDGGLGMLQALGAVITDESGDPIPVGENPLINFGHIDFAKPDELLKDIKLTVLVRETSTYTGSDSKLVDNGREIGLLSDQIVRLDLLTNQFNRAMRKERNLDLSTIVGAGAGGGIAGALACLDATISNSTYQWLFERLDFKKELADVDAAFLATDQVNQTRFTSSFVGELAKFCNDQNIRTVLMTLIRITPADEWNLPLVSTVVLPKIVGIKLPIIEEHVATSERELQQSLYLTTHEVAKLIN
ncbi:MAG TPA: glycerate kinase [Lapidilactobacillus dextrinicus]|uniref:Glycerate kinase n=1 Tax=Lapidilactobacillus dextrinicus TaxID=51664 RepID=A0A921B494_9LACO|nr:glycerate kinase [Lapidilactobacillus dextrinicus]